MAFDPDKYLAEKSTAFDPDAYLASTSAPVESEPEPEPERTVLGQVGETFKGVGRGFAGAFLSAGEGLAELADAATNVVGLEGLIDTGEENELVKASRAGRDWINNSALGVDPNYSDAWFTKFGEGVGSMASFLTPAAGLRALGAAGKATRLGMGTRELGAAATLATGAGAGDQAQRVAAARAQGLDVSQGQEDAAIALGGIIGLSEIAPIANILKRVPSNITPVDKSRILDLLQRSIRGGAEEAVQEAGAGLLQDLTEKGVYNENLPIGQSFWDDLTVGGAVGAFTDFVVNAAAGRRSFMTTEAQREYEAKARERQQTNIEKIRASLAAEAERRANRQADPAAFGRAAEAAQAGAVNIPAPTVDGPPVTAGQAYAGLISRELGEFFPTNTKFEVKETEPTVISRGTLANGEPIVEQKSNFIVVDSAGRQYGQTLQDREQAAGLAYGLNNEVIDGQIRGQILNTLETSGQSYDQVTADTLTRYGYQILNPEANMVTSAALNEAAGTTADKGYIENYSFQTILDGEEVKEDGKRVGYRIQGPGQKEMVVPGLTLAQQINQQRKAKGLAETQTFTVEEARDALGDKFERLTDINVQAIPDGMTYTATIVPTEVEVSKGKRTTVNIPSVVSSAGEVFQTRFASQEDSDASGKNEDGTPRVKVGQKIELQSLEDAQAFADRKNREAAKGQGLSVQEINALMKGEKTLTNEVTRLLKAKNVGSEIDTPEIKALFKSIVGKESLADMNFGEQRLLYARLRNLPTFEATTKLPLFEAKPYTRENFLRASKFVQDANALDQPVTDQQIAEAAGFLPGDERLQIKVDAIKQDLQKQGVPTVRPAKPVLALPAPTGTTDTYNFLREEIRKKMKGFGLDDIATRIDQTLLNYGDPVRYMQEMGAETEGYYNPFLREITLAVDRVDPDKTLTPEQRVNALVDVLNHEIVHPARELDLWTGQEWDTLSRASAKLRRRDPNTGQETNETYLQWANRTYADQSPLIREEESVADLSRQAKKFGNKAVSGKPKFLAERLFNFFDKLDNSFRGSGFQNYSEILDRLQSGEIGARTRGEIRTLRATEAELAKEGILPERFADYQPIIATPVARNQEREKKKAEVQQQVQAKAPAGTDFNPAMLEGAAIRESRTAIERVPETIKVDDQDVPTRDSEGRVIYSGYEGPEMFGMQTRPTQEGLQNFWRWFGKSKTVDSNKRPLVFYHGTAADITQFRPKQAGAVFMTRNPKFAEGFAGYSDNYLVSNFPDFMPDQQVIDVLNETLSSASAFTPKTYDKIAAARDQAVEDVQQNRPIRGSALTAFKDVASKGISSRYVNAIQKRLPSSANLMPVYVKADNPFDYENTDHVKRVIEEADRISPEPLSGFEAEGIFNGDWGVIETPKILAAIKNLGFDSMYVEEQLEKNLAVFDPNQIKSAVGNNGDFSPLTPSIRESRVRNPQIDTPEFQRFFKDSKAVDEAGEPQVFYHGATRDIDVFKPKPGYKLIFTSPDPNFASRYAANNLLFFLPSPEWGPQNVEWAERQITNAQFGDRTRAPTVYPLYVSAKNPFDFENKSHIAQLEKDLPKILSRSTPSREAYTRAEIRNTIDEIKKGRWGYIEDVAENTDFFEKSGYDSIYVEEAGIRNIAVFNPEQIKSAIGNNGDFSPLTPSIRESRSSAPIINALRVARTGFRDYSSSSQEQFFGNFWPRIIGSTRGQVSPSPENVRVAVERSINDLRPWLARNPRYLDYYNKDFAATRRILETKYGPLTEDQFTMFRLLSGLTSPSTELPDNISDALKSFDVWNQDGNFDSFVMGRSPKGNAVLVSAPFTLIGPTLSNKARTFKVIERLINEKGSVVNAVNFLKEQIPVGALHNFNREMGYSGPVGDINAIKGLVRMATGQDKLIPRMFIFGPKVGAYTLNMTGETGYNTVDIWESRLIRSYFTGLFSERYGLPGNVSEHELFQDFIKTFKEVFEQQTGKQWDTSALQAMRWFFIIDSARKAGYTEARTNETISEYVRRNIELPRTSRPYRRGQGDGDVGGEIPSIRESRLGSERARDRRGRDQGRAITPLEGSPTVQGGGPIPEIVGVAEQYAKDNDIPYNRQRTYVEVDEDRAKRIADAFEAMAHDPKNPAVAEAYRDLIKQTRAQYDALVNAGYRFTFFDADTDPYGGNAWNAIRDLRANKRMAVYGTYAGYGTKGITDSDLENNPLLEDTGLRWPDQNGVERMVTANDIFRAVHDALGHGIEGAGFRARGEENAWQAHARLFKGPALAALTSETRGQNSWLNYGPYGERNKTASLADTVFSEQKIGLMPEWTWQEGFESGYAPARFDEQVKEPLAKPQEQLDRAVKKAEENIAKAPFGTVPLYNLNASPEALYVAQNPEAGEKLDANDFIRYSRNNQPTYSPGVDQILDKLAVDPPNQTVGQTIVQGLTLSPFRRLVEIFRMNWINNNSRLEYLYQRDPNLMRNTADSSALVGVELADRHRAITASAIKDGVPVYRNGLVKVEDFIHNNRRYRGLAEVMAPLYSTQYGNLERLAQSYAIALRGRRLTAEGKLAPGDPADLPRLEAEVARFVNPETGNPIIKEWYDAWQAYNGYVVQFLRDTGMIDDAGAQLWLQQSDYIPFYRETRGGSVAHPKIFGGLTSTTHLKAVGKSSEAINMPLLESILTNLDAAIAMGMKNVAQQRIVRDMVQIGLGRMVQPGQQTEGLSTVTFKVQGKKYSAFIDDPLIFESMQALPELGVTGVLETVFRVPANILREMITREPGYMIANLLRDTASVTFTSQASIGAAGTAVKNFASGLDQLRRTGVIGGYDFARDPQDMAVYLSDEAKKMGHEIPVEYSNALGKVSRSKYLKPFSWIWDAAGQMSDRTEAFNRIRVYEDTLKRTGNEAEAVYQALSVLNYGRRGRSPIIRTFSAIVPFLNARIQGLDKLYQAGTGQFGPTRSRAKNALNFTARAGLMVGLTMYYYAMVSDDDEYKNANPEVLDNYYIFPTGMGFAIRIPIPFEVGLLFKTLPERIMRLSDGTDTFRDARQSAFRAATSTLAFNPIPQAVLPIAEIYANYDTFTGRSVIPPYMDERIAAEYQTRFGTNELARRLGEATGYSPIKIDHLLNGYFGTLGTYTLDAIDHLLRDADRSYPARDPYEYPFVRRFFADANQPGLQAQYYDLYKEVGKVTNTMRQLREDGRVEELNAYIMENQNILAVKSGVDALNKIMKNYRDQKDAVLKSPLEPEVKKQIIDQMDANMNATLQVMPILRRTAFNEQRQTGQ